MCKVCEPSKRLSTIDIELEDLFSIRGKVAVVTGGSRGIGFMVARGFVGAGARVYICSRHAVECDAAAEELSRSGQCVSIPADISQLAEIERFASELSRLEPRLHVLVNNAGTAWGAPIDQYPESGWDKVMDLNLKAIFFLTQKLLPRLRAAATEIDPARVINMGSVDGLVIPLWPNFAYSASKAAVHMLTRHIAYALLGDHVNVNAIAPGYFPTRMTSGRFQSGDVTGPLHEYVPMKRAGTPEDIVGTSIYLASRASAYVTGAVLPVSGGIATVDRQR